MRGVNTVLFVVMLFISSCVSAQEVKVDEKLEEKAFEAYESIHINKPSGTDPLSLGANFVWGKDKETLAIVMKVDLADEWHIYAKQRGTSAFVMTEIKTELPKGMEQIGEWTKPDAHHYSKELDVYEGELLFIGYFKVNSGQANKGKVGLYYQTCDPNQCFPPKTKMIDLEF